MPKNESADIIELTAATIIAAADITIEPVEVPEWSPDPKKKAIVYVRSMSMARKEKYVQGLRQIVGHGKKATVQQILEGSGAKLAAETMCDSKGNLLFKERSKEQIDALGKKSSKALERVIAKAAEINGLSDDEDEAIKNDSAERKDTTSDSNTD
jgi:hypothetical protein